MQQIEMFEPTTQDLIARLDSLEEKHNAMRKKMFAKFDACEKDYQLLYDNLELMKDFVEAVQQFYGNPAVLPFSKKAS